ncbi:D-alanyl-D-alanine carboxypeptidase family protein [Sphingomonas soli]|uniref:D-alanyl-D-alanine carboxypeptidase family protein n=1 Tax=Sphingomonas soli TaxID=266127 RepID=UPI000837933E|nr:D-alanyl-D-alanine carboxypeptidase family protein [Sphingomonas soli]
MKKLIAASILALAIAAVPTNAANPPYDTPAPIAYMEDLSSGAVLYAKDADRRIPPASMAKMMTVYVAFDLIKQGKLKLDDKFTVQPETWRKWHGPQAGSTMFLETGEQVSVQDLLYGVVTLSGNDACVVLAEGIAGTEPAFANLMNQQAKKLGLTNSQFGNSNGWPDEGRTYVTARDLAKLARATIEEHPQLYKQFYSQHNYTRTLSTGQVIKQDNRDPLLGRVAGADGLKTGHTQEAGYGFTGSAEQNGRRLIMVVAGLGSYGGRAEESVKFMNWGFRAWSPHPIVGKGKPVGDVEVQGGASSKVAVVAPRDLAATVPAGTSPEMQGRIIYQGPVKAPIKAGDHIADLVIDSPGMPQQTLPLVAAADVGEAGFFRRAWLGLWSLFGL